ncbi:primase C-terminal domain-containing protein [Neobacillus mesonae]|uniref:primase C-terminal domain-containing protein n=1 Tax=Neobacillus mesonae TaxID=1193713 RepID=UPI00203CA720|nr:primase C-terminal domain-containing protein [Neobacillus mesonae]MCM3569834.1 primase C-terminal domain-containing protein [Neobacillus mesonae]
MSSYSRALFGAQLSEVPKKQAEKQLHQYDQDHGWVFVSQDCKDFKAVRTYKTLFAVTQEATYFTPNTFYRNDQRKESSLRWLNALVIDIDVKGQPEKVGMTVPDVLDQIECAGLPEPSLIVQTPSKGFHVYFYFAFAKRAFPKTIEFYKRVQREAAIHLGGDLYAIGAERWFRVPTAENIVYESDNRVPFQELVDWMIIQQEGQPLPSRKVAIGRGDLLSHPAILRLLEGVEKGKRDNTCYTLALAFKASGYSKEEAETRLRDWNDRLEEPMRLLDIKRKVRSAFQQGSKKGPAASYIRMLSGMDFSYRPLEGAKPREERQRSHYYEWEEDVIRFLEQQGGSICCTQRQISDTLGMSFSTFKEVVKRLLASNRIQLTVTGKGRGAKTTITLAQMENHGTDRSSAPIQNEPVSYTLIDTVVGGNSSELEVASVISPHTYATGLLGYLSLTRQAFIRRIAVSSGLPADLVAYVYFYLKEEFGDFPHVILYDLLTTSGVCSYTRIDDLLCFVRDGLAEYMHGVNSEDVARSG